MIKTDKIINKKIYIAQGGWMEKYFKKLAYSLISTRFLVFIIACFLLWYAKISDMIWLFIALGFISVRTLNKFIEKK
jgi:hypothetical protein